jgi:hypothetical protein
VSTMQGEELFFDEHNELFWKLRDASIFAFAELIATAEGVNCWSGLAERIKVKQEFHESDRHAPTMTCQHL